MTSTIVGVNSIYHSRSQQVPWLFWLHDALSPVNLLGVTARHGSLRTFALRETDARKGRGSDRKDILSKLFAVHQEKPTEFNYNDLVSMATSNITAGSDTTAISTRAIIYYLLKNFQYKKRLIDEIDDFRKRGQLSDPVRVQEADNMPFLQAVLLEALRLHPAVGMSLPRVAPTGGATVAGHFIPAGTIIGANPWVIHRNKEVFGEDADQFRPERWMKDDNGDMRKRILARSQFIMLTRIFRPYVLRIRIRSEDLSWQK